MVTDSDLILDFVNTLHSGLEEEDLNAPRALTSWLVDRKLLAPGARATAADLTETIRVREALRTLLAAQNGVDGDVAAASAELDGAARRAGLGVRFDGGESRLEPSARGVRGAVGRILAEVSTAMSDGTWSRMKACRADDCLEAFLDTARNRSRAWCSMSSCGNREKVRAYRARHAAH